jgi:CBS domain-containing protein
MQATDLMTPEPVTTSPRRPVRDALRLMHDNDVRHLPVLDEGRLVGILSDRDLRALWWAGVDGTADGRLRDRSVEDFMAHDPYTVSVEDDVDALIDAFIDTRYGALPVLDADGALVGIVSVIDVLKVARGQL